MALGPGLGIHHVRGPGGGSLLIVVSFADEASARAAHAAVDNKRLHKRNIVVRTRRAFHADNQVRERRPRKGVRQERKSEDST